MESATYIIGDQRTAFVLTMDGTEELNNTYTYDGLGRLTGEQQSQAGVSAHQ